MPQSEALEQWKISLMGHIEGQVAFGDTKAGLLFTTDSILLAGLGLNFTNEARAGDLHTLTRVVVFGAGAALVVGLLLALLAIMPNPGHFWSSTRRGRITPQGGMMLFSWIAKQERDEYLRVVRASDVESLEDAVLGMVHGTAVWASRKFRLLWFAVAATMLSVLIACGGVLIEIVTRI